MALSLCLRGGCGRSRRPPQFGGGGVDPRLRGRSRTASAGVESGCDREGRGRWCTAGRCCPVGQVRILPRAPWACSAVGSAPPWHGGGQGFNPPQVHHREQESPPHEVVRAVVMQSAGTPSASALGHGMEVRPVHGSGERMERGDVPLLRFGVWRSLVARTLGEREVAGSNPAIPTRHCASGRSGPPTACFCPYRCRFVNGSWGKAPRGSPDGCRF